MELITIVPFTTDFNSVPIEKRDPKDKGKPMYLWDVLKEDLSEFGTSEYKYKMRIIDFLKSKEKVK